MNDKIVCVDHYYPFFITISSHFEGEKSHIYFVIANDIVCLVAIKEKVIKDANCYSCLELLIYVIFSPCRTL